METTARVGQRKVKVTVKIQNNVKLNCEESKKVEHSFPKHRKVTLLRKQNISQSLLLNENHSKILAEKGQSCDQSTKQCKNTIVINQKSSYVLENSFPKQRKPTLLMQGS